MEKLHLIKDGKITYAGMLMFYQDPERYIPACYTKVGYFKDGADLRYMDDIHGPLVKQVMQTIDILYAKYFRSYEEFEGVRRITHYQYPKEVIREAVCNAIIHRNYAQCNMVQIKVFPDKVMLFNNCIFPNGWTVDNLLKPHESKAINPLVAYAFYMMGYIDTWGRGIDKIVGGLKSVGQEKPVFEETKYSFCLSMKPLFVADEIGNATDESQNGPGKSHGFLHNSHELPSNFLANFLESFTENDAKVIEMIAENGRITAKEAASRIGISDRAVRSIIKKLKGCGAIKRVGPDKGGYWEVIIDEE